MEIHIMWPIRTRKEKNRNIKEQIYDIIHNSTSHTFSANPKMSTFKRKRSTTPPPPLLPDDEDRRMASVLSAASQYSSGTADGPCATTSYKRPNGKLFYCLRLQWRSNATDADAVSLTPFERSVPDTWENVRFRMEREMGLHNTAGGNRQTSFIDAKQIVDFDDRSIDKALDLTDDSLLEEHAVLIVYRRPSTHDIPHYIPLDLFGEWQEWFDEQVATQNARKGRKMFHARERDFYTRTHSRGHGKRWFRRNQLHASNYGDVPPKHWACPRCQVAGDHWEERCKAPDDQVRVAPSHRKMIHGIPRDRLRRVDPESAEGRMATLQDAEGNVYVDRAFVKDDTWARRHGFGGVETSASTPPPQASKARIEALEFLAKNFS